MEAGDITLEAELARLVAKQITQDGDFSADNFRDMYVKFMQTPGSHNDTFAATCHRVFFQSLTSGKDPKDCVVQDQHYANCTDSLAVAVPAIVKYHSSDKSVRQGHALAASRVIRQIEDFYCNLYSEMLVNALEGKDLRVVAQEAADQIEGFGSIQAKIDASEGKDPVVSCGYKQGFEALLFLVFKYSDSLERAILASANAGGDNVGRAALLGPLFGAAYGFEGFQPWMLELRQKDALIPEIDQFVAKI